MANSARFNELELTRSKTFARRSAIIENPEVIKIMTIKPRIVEEMGFFNPPKDAAIDDVYFDVLGQYGNWLIIKTASNDLKKLGRADFISWLLASHSEMTIAMANDFVRAKVPQLFSG